jgi:MFS family permease
MPPPHAEKPHPTSVRHLVVALATAMAVLLYLDRICLSITERYIKEDIGLSDTQVGFLLSAFFWTYALAQVPSGWLSDRYGARKVLTSYIVLWSLFTGLLGVANSFMLLVVFRLSCGLTQAGAYPTSAALLSKWAPLRSRGLASGIVSTGGRLGGFLAPLLTAYLMVSLVPINTSSRLDPADLLDGGDLCRTLSKETGPTANLNRLILAALPPDVRAAVATAGATRSGSLTPEQGDAVVAALNKILVHQDLAAGGLADEIDLSPEARKLAATPAASCTEDQQQRLNRLILEAAYPDAIRKIYGRGWRPVMLIYGLAGIVVAGLFWLGVRDRPELHPGCNAAEMALIAEGRTETPVANSSEGIQIAPSPAIQSAPPQVSLPASKAPVPLKKLDGIPLGPILRSRSLWLSSVSQFMTNFGWVFIITWMPRYLEEVYHVPVKERGWMTSVPILVGMTGMLAGGPVTDRLTKALGLRWGRGIPMALTRFVAVAAFLACMAVSSPWQAMLVLSVMAVSVDLGTPAIWAFCQDVGGRHVGSILGWGNMWGNLGAAVSPLVINWIKGPEKRWDLCFLACAVAFFIAGIVSLGIDARIPVVPAADEPDA